MEIILYYWHLLLTVGFGEERKKDHTKGCSLYNYGLDFV
jgi:hypothetical protein